MAQHTEQLDKVDNVQVNEHLPVSATDAETTQLGHLANQEDHEVGKLESFKKYPWACAWCIYAVWCVLLVSFENQASGNVIGIPEFRKDFGHAITAADGSTTYVIDAQWQSAFQGAPVASAIVGALGCGQLADWLGRRMVVALCLVVTFAAVTMEFVATTNGVFFGGKFLNGFVVGALASVTVTYIGEIAPLALRGMLTCLTALAYTLGPLVVALIVNWTGVYTNRWAYRAVFCSQYGFAAISAIFWPFMPESPWWLASKERPEQALKALSGLGYKGEEGVKKLALITNTLNEVRKETEGVTYLECFRRSNLRRTIISILPLSIQALSGIAFAASYSTYYMQLAGFTTEMSFKLQIVQQVISLVGNTMSWYLVDRMGRRNLTFYGLFLNLGGRLGFIFGGLSCICLVYLWFYQPETAGRTYEELDEMFIKKIPARKFKSYKTDAQAMGEAVKDEKSGY
ncbi:MFS general substrate transporter [Aaosphaeria arxii CBS 175.79]|uniref:MFS general substrate transporter n=1 Tax=Aaosphaeria arxii CBS 175.79 TaxID=1450172 RepID=A0A6A5XM25_9PLEO|nr:MFS general substrate transporter [Aaosphaeria arxii CBS 175.79]KAF2013993.1 MFS general substrate transporter [Aaosphaeria arxii CBS 175.79]